MNQNDPNAQRAQNRDVEQNVGEILVRDDGPINADDEELFSKAGNVMEDASKVREFHVATSEIGFAVCRHSSLRE